MIIQPEYLKHQAEQKARDRQRAIGIAVERLNEAEADFKLAIIKIKIDYDAFEDPNFVYAPTRKADANRISADPTVAQYA